MRLGRRTRMVLRWVWLLPAIGATVDLVVAELVPYFHPGILTNPWLLTSIGLGLVPLVFLAYGLWWPDPKEEGITFEEGLTGRSRVLGSRINARSIRIYTSDLETRFGHRDYIVDRTDLLLSQRIADLPSEELDFFIAQRLASITYCSGNARLRAAMVVSICISITSLRLSVINDHIGWVALGQMAPMIPLVLFGLQGTRAFPGRVWPVETDTLALFATGNMEAALRSLSTLGGSSKSDLAFTAKRANELRRVWESGLRFDVIAEEWYKQEQLRQELEARARILRVTDL